MDNDSSNLIPEEMEMTSGGGGKRNCNHIRLHVTENRDRRWRLVREANLTSSLDVSSI